VAGEHPLPRPPSWAAVAARRLAAAAAGELDVGGCFGRSASSPSRRLRATRRGQGRALFFLKNLMIECLSFFFQN
jgi:hypothetical protein